MVDKSLIVGHFGEVKPSETICGFDMDSTLTLTKGTHTFCWNGDDWKWWNKEVPKKLKEEHKEGHWIVIMSNQNGIGKGHFSQAELKKKMKAMHDDLKIPFTILAATEEDNFRKPGDGMWKYFTKHLNEDVKVNYETSFYCGDAAGRPATKSWKKDFTNTDKLFAIACKLKFLTPEQYFLKEEEKEEES